MIQDFIAAMRKTKSGMETARYIVRCSLCSFCSWVGGESTTTAHIREVHAKKTDEDIFPDRDYLYFRDEIEFATFYLKEYPGESNEVLSKYHSDQDEQISSGVIIPTTTTRRGMRDRREDINTVVKNNVTNMLSHLQDELSLLLPFYKKRDMASFIEEYIVKEFNNYPRKSI